MSLVIEDGSGSDPLANSYIDPGFFFAFFEGRYGVDEGNLNLNDIEEDKVNRAIVRATDFFESLEYRMKGDRSYIDQPLSWPRRRVIILSGISVSSTTIPNDIKKTLAYLTYNALEFDILPESVTQDGVNSFVVKEEIHNAVSIEYENSAREGTGLKKYLITLSKYLRPGNRLIRS